MGKTYYKTLDGLRAIAIILVSMTHLSYSTFPEGNPLRPLAVWGFNGVDLFFAISGFLIGSILLRALHKNNNINLKSFYIRRIFRLTPVVLFYFFVLTILKWAGLVKFHFIEFISTISFWRNQLSIFSRDLSHDFKYTDQLWSLSVEEVFYLVLPISLIFFYKKRKVLWGIVGMIALSTIWRKFGTMPNIVEAFPFIKYHMWSTLGRFDALLYGVLGAYLHRADKYKLFFAKINPFFLILVLYFLNNYNVPFKPTFEAITFALIVLSCTSKDSGLLVTFLENPVFKFLGKISYSYYVFQQIALLKMDLAPAWLKALTGEYYSVFFALTFALISYYLIENPMRKIGIEISNRQIATKKV